MNRTTLVEYLNDYLRIAEIDDYGPQGLQLEAHNEDVRRIALAVDTAPPVIEAAAGWDADMLLVHHGILWRDVERLAGPLGRRVRLLLGHDIHLYAAHLPLDAHPHVGNNAVLAQLCGMQVTEWWCDVMGTRIGVLGDIEIGRDALVQDINQKLNTQARMLAHGPEQVRRLAIVSGFGADKAAVARGLGADTFLTGETSHAHFYAAADYDMNVIFAGHYTTETVGVRALGHHLSTRFDVETRFFDFPTAM